MKDDQDSRAPGHFSPAEEHELGRSLRAGEGLTCPRCRAPLDARQVPQRTDVSYVRDRVLVACPICHRTSVLDRREVR